MALSVYQLIRLFTAFFHLWFLKKDQCLLLKHLQQLHLCLGYDQVNQKVVIWAVIRGLKRKYYPPIHKRKRKNHERV